ncbi:Phosphocarrier protein HPr [Rubripirellula amarantea]|uniref:Phosphocarrier protein HPr n=1 Tax=Rubripirellula amarantea TaxID=2527999 RepID=A0A5C5WJ07_9BACT|nr:HPr family phosphocarrier protein [Rubripirellula amarantea]TWT50738.1 Phosphocarrier protein HPr [Rubripirellula amarantea]
MSNAPLVRKVVVQNLEGLHARPAHLLVKAANNFQADITIGKNAEMMDCKSILSLLMLGAAQGTELTISVVGPDAPEALETILALFESGFDEGTGTENSVPDSVAPQGENPAGADAVMPGAKLEE